MRCLVLMLLILAKSRGQTSTPTALPSASEVFIMTTETPIMSTVLSSTDTSPPSITMRTAVSGTTIRATTSPTTISTSSSTTLSPATSVSTAVVTTPLLNTLLQDFQTQEQSFQNFGEQLGQDVKSQQEQLKNVGQQIAQQVQSADQAYLNVGKQVAQQVKEQEQQIQNVDNQLLQDAKAQEQTLQQVGQEVSQEVQSQEQAYQNAEEKSQQKAPLIPSSSYPSSYQPPTVFGVPATALGGLSLLGSSPQLQSLWQLAGSRGIPVLSGLSLGI